MSDEIVARKLRLIPQDLRIASPVHFSEVFTKPELATIFEQIDAGRIAHEAADLIERQQARIAELEKDAARYRWLAENPTFNDREEMGAYYAYRSGTTFYTDKASLDKQIDRAMEPK